jgi:hypothetical protein
MLLVVNSHVCRMATYFRLSNAAFGVTNGNECSRAWCLHVFFVFIADCHKKILEK